METNGQQQNQNFSRAHGGRARRVAAFAVAAAVLGATAACTGSSGSPTSGGTSSAGTSLSPTAGATTTTAQAGATSTGTNAANSTSTSAAVSGSSSSAGSRAVSGGTASCTGSEIKVTLSSVSAAMSHDGQALVFTNTGSQTCTLQGYPGAAVMSGSAVLVNSTRSLNGYISDDGKQLSSAPLVTLAPGGKASAMLEWEVNAGETCYPNGSGTLEATPPNTTTTTSLESMTVGSNGMCAGFEVHPIIAGTFNN